MIQPCVLSVEKQSRDNDPPWSWRTSVVMEDSVLEENLVTCNGGLFSFQY